MSKIKHYETMFILKPTLTEEETVAQIENIRAIIEKNGGEIAAFENVGIKELAYEIEKCKRGYYYVIYFRGNPSGIAEIERNYRINENLIRFIFIKYDSKKEVASWTKMSEEAAKKASK
ncbi:30S ribosomal protein S6 [Arcobacter cloacae]|uniref:Small ribosomal subunit protein bS6 n=1 Tax=Arcobacter cloacae TaxID=1054034 RepID=A0A4Q0ZJF5_9BACT|nr:30S ribosomal protein S6 [Arcobacter cloacae]NCB10390.1 30S ribosomal protein S6 [Erysipelotrichia bacterium]QKF88890.1 30S ribosomal protein S6 [Arcobacter cloacae]RXI42239.1 30S ribosomal protein S6 [Arcobacter cloacae]RXJ83688.1 30S ribosomal protein S6 [Arcobacter cloacae]